MVKYSIKDMELLSGIKAHTIRIWERRYQLFEPERTLTNIRHYTDNDLKKLLNVAILNRNGIKISNIVSMNDQEINDRITDLSESFHDDKNQTEQLILAMIDFDESRFERVLSSSVISLGFDEAVTRILYPFFEYLDMLRMSDSIYSAQENFIANLIRQKLIIAIDGQVGNVNDNPKTFLMFLPVNEWNELTLLFYNYLLREAGHNSIYLAQALPLDNLPMINDKKNIDYIFTSFTTPIQLKKYTETVNQISQTFINKKVFISGAQTRVHSITLPENVEIIEQPAHFMELLKSL
ncbi:MAG: MerR family transcriptional regulator [Lentimicrobiaceae bacterium]